MAFHEFKSHNNSDLCNTCSIIIEHVLHKSNYLQKFLATVSFEGCLVLDHSCFCFLELRYYRFTSKCLVHVLGTWQANFISGRTLCI